MKRERERGGGKCLREKESERGKTGEEEGW
jgi:hypothetical protein